MFRISMLATLMLPLVVGSVSAETSRIGDLRPGMSVDLTGSVTAIPDEDEFILSDASGEVLVYIGPNAMPVQPSDKIRVIGVVDDDGPLEVYAREIVFSDGRRVEFTYSY